MRIIDNRHDFYDYLQDSTDTIVFDRRNSFLLTKEHLCSHVEPIHLYAKDRDIYRFLLLQCGATYWLILMTITKFNSFKILDYKLELLSMWKNYDKSTIPIKLSEIKINALYKYMHYKYDTYTNYINNATNLQDAINNNDFKEERIISHCMISKCIKNTIKREIKDMPILNACGIMNIIDPVDIFTAIEEHFSLEKTNSERIEPLGATNDDKIVMHGFDTKISFRGN